MNLNPLAIALILANGVLAPTAAMADTPPTAPGNLTARLYVGAGTAVSVRVDPQGKSNQGQTFTGSVNESRPGTIVPASSLRVSWTRTLHQSALALTLASLMGCGVTQRDNFASRETLEPAGWRHVETSLDGSDFDAYAADVRRRLIQHRIPIDPLRASLEIERAVPRQFDPVESCNSNTRGVAILVHGLSDTAYTMSDLARYFASRCYVARTVLLPGHGTRAGDMLVVDHQDWTDTVRHLVDQAAGEHSRVILVGFSLGAVVSMTVALDEDSPVDAMIGVSPAYHISTWNYARFAPFVHRLYRWVDKGMAEDSQRYEAMPTKGVAELVRALGQMHDRIDETGGFDRPWLLAHSLDDNTTVPDENREFVLKRGSNSHVVEFFSDQDVSERPERVKGISSISKAYRVNGLTHLAVHIAPDNPHYGIKGDYRHCGTVDGRDADEASRCERANEVTYVDWGKLPPSGEPPTALSSFNPRFDLLEKSLDDLLNELGP